MALTLRLDKGTALTYQELDDNFLYLSSSIAVGGGGTAAGSDTQIQFNSGSVFSGSANLRYSYTNNALLLTGSLDVSGSGRFTDGLTITGSAIVRNDLSVISPDASGQLRSINTGYNTQISIGNRGGGNIIQSTNATETAAATLYFYGSGIDFGNQSVTSVGNLTIVTGSLTIMTGSINVSGSGRFTDGLTVTGSTNISSSGTALAVVGNVNLNGWLDTNVLGNSLNWGKSIGTGIYFANPISDVGLKVGSGIDGTSRLILTNAGNIITPGVNNVGIGTITPEYKLHITGSSVSGSFNANNKLIVSSSRVSISGSLDVSGSGRFTDGLTVTGSLRVFDNVAIKAPTNLGYFLQVGNPNDNGALGFTFSDIYYNAINGHSINFKTGLNGGTEETIMSIRHTGNIGIKTTAPSASLDVSGSGRFTDGLTVTGSLDVSGSGRFTNFVTASAALLSGSGTQRLRVIGSGSSEPLFQVLGSQGELFSVTDILSGSLFSVNDISGLPVIEAFSDNTVLMGSYASPSLNTTILLSSTTAGVNTIYTLATSSYDAIFMDYVIRSGSVGRAGTFTAMWSGSSTNFTDSSGSVFGDSTGFIFGANVTGSSLLISGSGSTAGWKVKTIIRSI
jgi:hypothetical protein